MEYPNFSKLSLNVKLAREEWLEACGERLPTWKSWKRLSGRDKKRLMHSVALEADDSDSDSDSESDSETDYLTPYEQLDIQLVMKNGLWSVEHVVPQSKTLTSASRSDPLGWTTATRNANSRRSNLPLMLWLAPDGKMALPNSIVKFNGVRHYAPPMEQRARLARKWMYIRATYSDEVESPSDAQIENASKIVALAHNYPIGEAESLVNSIYKRDYGWSNPLLTDKASRFYESVEWRNLVFKK